MTYTNEKIAVKINGRRYVRKMYFMTVGSTGSDYEERHPFITINGEEYLVFRRNGVPCSVYKWADYLDYLNAEAARRRDILEGVTP